jgi:hypothetical protein
MAPSRQSTPAACGAPVSVLVLLIGTFMAVLDFFIVNVAIPDMQHRPPRQ